MTDTLAAGATAFLSWARQGLAAQWTALGAQTANGRLELHLSLTLDQAGATPRSTPVTAPVLRLQGPADVTEIKSAQVIRTEPAASTLPFEPNFFAAIEFDRPDLPWLFSPTAPDAQNRCTPWITLVVLPKAVAQIVPAGEKTLATITCPRGELPRLEEAWAWAHVQITGGTDGGPIATLLADSPRALSRLICPRHLLPTTAYLACVVPTYELGRLAGLGVEIPADLLAKNLQPAWGNEAEDAPVTLPVYYQWAFDTGEDGDFESLASRLKPNAIPDDDSDTLKIDLTQPGWGIATNTGGTLPMRGALALLGAMAVPDGIPPAWTQSNELTNELTAILNAPNTVVDGLIGPPLYGRAYPRIDSLDPAVTGRNPPVWLETLNKQVEHRIAAGLGALTVRIEQDAMMAAAWDQLAEFDRENQAARRQQLAAEAGLALERRSASASLAATQLRGLAMQPLRSTPMPGPGLAPQPQRAKLALKVQARGRAAGATAGPSVARRARIAAAMLGAQREARAAIVTVAPRALGAGVAAPPPATELATFTPRFATPAGELLKDFFPSFLFPGLQNMPVDSVTALAPNQVFIEAYLVGLNHEFGREMLWRGFPADSRGTAFQRFWPLQTTADITPLAQWDDSSALGSHGSNSGVSPLTVVLVKGALLQRYPRAAIYAQQARWDGSTRVLDAATKTPIFQMDRAPDVTLLAFDLPPDAFLGAAAPPGAAGWFFVLQEHPDEHRFGLDAVPDGYTGPYGGLPETWADLSWAHVAASDEALAQVRYLTLDRLQSIPLPLSADAGSAQAIWGQSSTDIAAITRQPPFRLAIHGSEWFAPPTT